MVAPPLPVAGPLAVDSPYPLVVNTEDHNMSPPSPLPPPHASATGSICLPSNNFRRRALLSSVGGWRARGAGRMAHCSYPVKAGGIGVRTRWRAANSDPGYRAEKFEIFEPIKSIRETNESFDSCKSCKRLALSCMGQNFRLFLYRIYPFKTFDFFCLCIRGHPLMVTAVSGGGQS